MPSVTPPEYTTLDRKQPAELYLRDGTNTRAVARECEVIRIDPNGMRLVAPLADTEDLSRLFHLNRQTEVILPLPRPHSPVRTKVRITAVHGFYTIEPPMVRFDLEFIELSAREEEALRDSNPNLLAVG